VSPNEKSWSLFMAVSMDGGIYSTEDDSTMCVPELVLDPWLLNTMFESHKASRSEVHFLFRLPELTGCGEPVKGTLRRAQNARP
jgi:hypothetical protein